MGRMTDFERGNIVRVANPLDVNYDCEAEVKSFNVKTGEYGIEFITGDSKGETKKYSAADLKIS